MDSKKRFLFEGIKRITPQRVVDMIKDQQESLKGFPGYAFAQKAASQVFDFSNEEFKIISGKLHFLGQKTSLEFEKAVEKAVHLILQGQPEEDATPEVQQEILAMLVEHNNGKNILPLLKYVNSVILGNVPTAQPSSWNFKKNIAKTLINDAKIRIKNKNIVEAQVVLEEDEAPFSRGKKKQKKAG